MQTIEWLHDIRAHIGGFNILALFWFIFLWKGYSRFAHYRARRHGGNLSAVMNNLRKRWMRQMVQRELRIPDVAMIANLERNVTFLASTSMLILAALLTALAATDKMQSVLVQLPFYRDSSLFLLQLKIFILIIIYVYAFFTLSWSMRQYGFATVVLGSAPLPKEAKQDQQATEIFIRATAKIIDLAAHTYNRGLRAYYYSLAVLTWFVNVWFFIATSTLIVLILYVREFHSRPLRELRLLQ